MVEIVERVNAATPTWRLLGFLAPDESQVGSERNGIRVLGTAASLAEYRDVLCVPDNTWPHARTPPRERLASLIDPSAFVSRTAKIGAGVVLYPNSFVGLDATLGDRDFCLSGCVINHGCVVQERVVMASGVTLAGSVVVEPDVYLGQSCTVKQHVTLGRGSLIGMGAVVIHDVPPGSVVVGNPGRVIRTVDAAC
jgi:sugar O-acyltransferase (sialic acid O-acetyltransferase NeuD family)